MPAPAFLRVLAAGLLCAARAAAFPLTLAATVALPDSTNATGLKLDHLSLAPTRGLLYISMRQNNSLAIVDVAQRSLVEVLLFATPKGVWADEAGGRLFVAAAGDGDGRVYSIALDPPHIPLWGATVPGCDILKFDAAKQLIYVTADAGIVVLDPTAGAPFGSPIPTGSSEDFYFSAWSNLVLVSLPSQGSVIGVADRGARRLITNFSLAPFTQPYASHLVDGTALGAAALVAGAGPRLYLNVQGDAGNPASGPAFVVLNALDGQRIASIPTAPLCDGMYWDLGLQNLYVTCAGDATPNAGVLFAFNRIVSATGQDSYMSLGFITTPAYARMGFWDEASGTLFVGAPAVPAIGQTASLLIFSRTPSASAD